jgi:hypothetical protein
MMTMTAVEISAGQRTRDAGIQISREVRAGSGKQPAKELKHAEPV